EPIHSKSVTYVTSDATYITHRMQRCQAADALKVRWLRVQAARRLAPPTCSAARASNVVVGCVQSAGEASPAKRSAGCAFRALGRGGRSMLAADTERTEIAARAAPHEVVL